MQAEAPTRYWHRLDDGRIQCDLCPRACKLREGQRGSASSRARENDQIVLTTLRPLERLLRRSDREEAAQPLPARHRGPVVRHGRLQPRCRFCQNWDISKSRETDTLADAASPEEIAAAAAEPRLRAAWRSPTTTRSSSSSTRSTSPTPAAPAAIKTVAVTAGYVCPEPRGEFYRAHGRGERRPQGLHARTSTATLRAQPPAGARHARSTCHGDQRVVRDHDAADPRRATTPTRELDAMTAWVAEHLGPDVPLHFTAFHPDFKMLGPAADAA